MGRLSKPVAEGDGMQQRKADRCLAMVDKETVSKARARTTAVLLFVAILSSAYLLMPAAAYLPEGEEPKSFSIMTAPPDYNLSEMQKIGDELREFFTPYVDANPDAFTNGDAEFPSLLFYNMRVSIGGKWMVTISTKPDDISVLMDLITCKFESYLGMRGFHPEDQSSLVMTVAPGP